LTVAFSRRRQDERVTFARIKDKIPLTPGRSRRGRVDGSVIDSGVKALGEVKYSKPGDSSSCTIAAVLAVAGCA
jgi:hypothetical protein